MPPYYGENRYKGEESIVVAMDIGTTQSAVSFAFFSPGVKPQGKMVAHWPGLGHWSEAAKTPSLVSYQNGVFEACGAEALVDFEEHPEKVAYWFKLHLHPAVMTESFKSPDFEIPPLPPGITIERVYSDIMRYLMENTRMFFEDTNVNGADIWARLRDNIVILLATPNGWDIREQAILRKAAIRASLVTEANAGRLLEFVTEAEASVHYALSKDHIEWLKRRTVFAVIDCGGSTVDTTVYHCISTDPLELKEACPSVCVQAGGIFVNREVEKMLKARLNGSLYDDCEVIKRMMDAFESELKPKFDGTMENYNLRFGGITDNDQGLGIHKGKIILSNQELKPVFDRVTKQIIDSCSNALISRKTEVVLIVGGFGESPHVRNALKRELGIYGMQVITIGDFARKAAAEGAIISHIKHYVVSRAAKATFGGYVFQIYNKKLHHERRHAVQIYAEYDSITNGKKRVDGAFHVWIKKGTILRGTVAHKLSYHVAWDAASISKSDLRLELQTVGIDVFGWERDSIPPIWCKDEQGAVLEGMRLICTLNADLSQLAGGIQVKNGPRGKRFYRVDYDVCVYFGGTQVRASLQWKEGRSLREGPVTVVPDAS